MRKKLKRRFIKKIQRKGVPAGRGILFAKLSDSLEEAKEMRRLEKVKNRHKIRYEGPYAWLHWQMYSIIVKKSGRRLGSTSAIPSWATATTK